MITVPFTQYVRPNGRKREVSIEVNDTLAPMVQAIIAKGLRFECEVLSTGVISLSISNGEEDITGVLVDNGPGVRLAVERMIQDGYSKINGDKQ